MREIRPSHIPENVSLYTVGPLCKLVTPKIQEIIKWFSNTSNKGLAKGSNNHLASVFCWLEERLANYTCPNNAYKNWVNNRVLLSYSTQLDNLGLLDVVKISVEYEKIDWTFFATLVAFWNPCINQFQYPEGYMSATLFGVFAITGCLVTGESLPLSVDDDLCAKAKIHMKNHNNKFPS